MDAFLKIIKSKATMGILASLFVCLALWFYKNKAEKYETKFNDCESSLIQIEKLNNMFERKIKAQNHAIKSMERKQLELEKKASRAAFKRLHKTHPLLKKYTPETMNKFMQRF